MLGTLRRSRRRAGRHGAPDPRDVRARRRRRRRLRRPDRHPALHRRRRRGGAAARGRCAADGRSRCAAAATIDVEAIARQPRRRRPSQRRRLHASTASSPALERAGRGARQRRASSSERWHDVTGCCWSTRSAGCTSHDVVQQARRDLSQKRIGHCGTLDPDATGLLLADPRPGDAADPLPDPARPRSTRATIRFGVATDTYDAVGRGRSPSGRPRASPDGDRRRAMAPLRRHLRAARSPAYSARKVQGVKLLRARPPRRGRCRTSPRKSRSTSSRRTRRARRRPRSTFRLSCSSGTYARTLAHDLGAALGCGAHLAALRRTQIGSLPTSSDALPIAGDRAPAAAPARTLGSGLDRRLDAIPLPFARRRRRRPAGAPHRRTARRCCCARPRRSTRATG